MSTHAHSIHQHLQETRKLLMEHQNGNIYTVKELNRGNRPSQMMIPVHQYVGRPITVHEDVPMGEQCDDPLSKSPVRLLFCDLNELKPSPKYPIATRIGFVQFAYHLATHGEKQTSVHPVSVWIRDRVKLNHEGFDSIREHRALQEIRPQGFESSKARRPDYHPSIFTQPVQHPRDYFPQWNFLRDGHNDYVVTEFAADGNLVRFVHSQIDMYRFNYLHERLASMDLSFLGSERQLRSAVASLWQQEALCICAKIADAVAYMHSRGVCHLNLSPQSILVTETLNPMIIDFDQAELADTDGVVGRNRSILSKIAWQAPEIAKHNRNGDKSAGIKGHAADVYALGVLMYYLLAIYPPHVTDRSKPVMDPVTQDRSWISNLRAHISGETLSHESADCHICNGKLHFDDRVMFVLHNAFHPNSQSRLSASQISQALADFQTDFEPDLFCRLCQLSASEVVKNDEALAHG